MSTVKTIMGNRTLRGITAKLLKQRFSRRMVLNYLERRARETALNYEKEDRPAGVSRDKADLMVAMVAAFDRGLERNQLSERSIDKIMEVFVSSLMLSDDQWKSEGKETTIPPLFLTISPTQQCNLHCTGCYASSGWESSASLSREVLERIISEKRRFWGSHLTVISGGEPFLWKDGDYSLLNLFETHPDEMFMVYTNGTFLNEEVTKRLGNLGNVAPAISVEGFEPETDGRRGFGVHRKIMMAFDNLRQAGVPFGISATATRHNWRIITSEKFADFYFFEQGAFFGWLFQYMPIGRAHTLELQVPPEERVEMGERTWDLVRRRKIFCVDFWNSGTASNGCIAAGRSGGYFYINWNGDVAPCVFMPYAACNIHDIYGNGGTINDALSTPFFKRIREFQDNFGYRRPAHETGNWLTPCSFRDHFEEFYKTALETRPRPIDSESAAAMGDADYRNGLIDYGRKMKSLTDKIWQSAYIASAKTSTTAEKDDVLEAVPSAINGGDWTSPDKTH
jgi:MoaA/NifB/PqqE/SkfB family radical SAM enzyme